MPRTQFLVASPDAKRVARKIEHVADRFVELEPGYEDAMRQIVGAHERFFNRLRGRYVRTGATRASLTQPTANGAIRAIHRSGLRFGTRVPWAHFLTKGPHDPEAGQIRKDDSGKGRSAVVIFPRSLQRSVTRTLLDYIMEPVD